MRYLALLLIWVISLPAAAVTKVNLYQTQVTVDPQNAQSDNQIRIQGMEQVLVRATGSTSALQNSVVKKALNHNSQYLTQISRTENDQGQDVVKLGFNAVHIRELLTQAQLPFWPAQRTNILVWLVKDTDYDRQIIWENSGAPLLQKMHQEARVRGLPLTLPVGDFSDVTGLSTTDLWGGFTDAIGKASARYPTDAIMVVQAQGDDIHWTLYDQSAHALQDDFKQPITGQASGDDAMKTMVDTISEYYAQQGGVVVSDQSSQSLNADFSHVTDAQDFFNIEKMLKSLSSVASVNVQHIHGNDVQYRVHLLTSADVFKDEVLRNDAVQSSDAQNDWMKVETTPQFSQQSSQVDETGLASATDSDDTPAMTMDSGAPQSMDNQTQSDNSDMPAESHQPNRPTLHFIWNHRN
ncbi:MAG: DUF2066 domain-containing protein [Vibrio sp.]